MSTPYFLYALGKPHVLTLCFPLKTHYTADNEYHCLVLLAGVKMDNRTHITFGGSITYLLHFTRVTNRVILIRIQRILNHTVSQASRITDVDFTLFVSHSCCTKNQGPRI